MKNYFKSYFYVTCFMMVSNVLLQAQSSSPYVNEMSITIQSEDTLGKSFEANSHYAYMQLNITNGDFLLSLDAVDLRTGDSKLDTVLIKKGSQPIVFKGNIAENLFLFNRQVNDEKLYKMQGQLIVNNTAINCIALFDPINYGDKSETKNYRMDFNLEVDASNIVILGLENKINNKFIIDVNSGKLNIKQ